MTCEKLFHRKMVEVARFSNAHGFGQRFKMMLGEYGGVETAKRLLATSEIQTGFWELSRINRLDMSMEAYVLQEPFTHLFTSAEIAEAQNRFKVLKNPDM